MVSEEEEDRMCGKSMLCHWQPGGRQHQLQPGGRQHQLQPQWNQRGGSTKNWSKAVRGRPQQHQAPVGASRGRKRGQRSHHHQHPHSYLHHHHHHHHHQPPRHFHHSGGGAGSGRSLRPFNVKGNRAARGMCAPKNTNQFLMHEKYQFMKMRSDSTGSTDSSSDSELELTDMDSYLRVLENARGALPDDNSGLEHHFSPSQWSPRPGRQHHGGGPLHVFTVQGHTDILSSLQEAWGQCPHQEDSMQYFPSEDDVLQSEQFMQKDFNEFCDTLTDDTA